MAPHAALQVAFLQFLGDVMSGKLRLTSLPLPRIGITVIVEAAVVIAILVLDREQMAALQCYRDQQDERTRSFFHGAFQGMTLRSTSRKRVEVMTPRSPMVTMPTNIASTCKSSQDDQMR